MSRYARQLAKPVKLELINDDGEKDIYMIRPLPFEFDPEWWEFTSKLSKVDWSEFKETDDPEELKKLNIKLTEVLDKESIRQLLMLIDETLKESYPDESDEKERRNFASRHKFEMMNVMLEVNSHGKPKIKDTKTKVITQ